MLQQATAQARTESPTMPVLSLIQSLPREMIHAAGPNMVMSIANMTSFSMRSTRLDGSSLACRRLYSQVQREI